MWSRPAWSRNASRIVKGRYTVRLAQFHRLIGPRVRPPFEEPRCNSPGRRLDFRVGSSKRALLAVFGHEDDVVVPSNAQVDRALRHTIGKRSEPVTHMLRLRQDVEDELDR